MRRARRIPFLLSVVVALCLASPVPSWAHRDRGPGDPCRREVGASLLHITFYQTQFDPVTEYCEEIPRVGTAFLVVDVTPDLWEMPIGVELLASDGSGQSNTVLSLPVQVYERGVANAEVLVQAGLRYEVRVLLGLSGEPEPRKFSFPFQVAAWYKALVGPALIVFGVVIVLAVSVIRYKITVRGREELVK
ncbi:MAG: hypothetical protein OXC18_12960 [Desulfurellaceae bacterium]|nr:hypothetical protein [Desulfurellaceae bacterium]